jgi:aryl-alcohol dehydrogenase-like predicted oxidoreductase
MVQGDSDSDSEDVGQERLGAEESAAGIGQAALLHGTVIGMQPMERRHLAGTDLNVSLICCGTMSFGADLCGKELDAHIARFRDAGGNFFDSAHCYAFWLPSGAGSSECALGQYIRRNGRGDLLIGTKGGHPGVPGYRRTEHWLSPERIEADVDDSLGRLGVDEIDLFWLHRDDTRLPAGEIIETLNLEIDHGRIRHLGASNWRTDRIADANAYAAAHGLRGFVASQPEWSLASKNTRNPDPLQDTSHGTAMLFLEDGDIAWHRQSRLPVIPYTPTAGGFFASGGRRNQAACDNPISRARLARACALAAEMNVSPGQIALAWLLCQEFPVFPISGTHNPGHLRENLGSVGICLTAEQTAWLAG